MSLSVVEGEGFVLRPWQPGDRDSLVRHANDERVSRGLSDRFPFPYTHDDARSFLAHPAEPASLVLAIEIDGEAVGGIGMRPGEDTLRIGSQLGYWLGQCYWGRGIMSRILPRWCEHVFANYGFERLQATVLSSNPASARVLEKSGFEREGTLRRAAIKRSEVLDLWMYAMLRPVPDSTRRGI